MDDEPLLRRKLSRARPRVEPDVPGGARGRALPRALVRVLSAGTGLAVQPGPVTFGKAALSELSDRLPEDGFIALLAPAGAGDDGAGASPPTGLIALDGGLFSALVETMTMGRLSARPAPPRRPTATDAALLGALIDRFLAECEAVAADSPPSAGAAPPAAAPPAPRSAGAGGARAGAGGVAAPGALQPWRLRRALSDLRLLEALLEDVPYRFYRTPVSLTSGAVNREGDLLLLLPEQPPRAAGGAGATTAATGTGTGTAPAGASRTAASGQSAPPAAAGGAEGDDPFADTLRAQVMGAAVKLDGVLGRIVMPLSDVIALSRGQRLELPVSRLEEVELAGLDGKVQALARLGQSRGMRALRIVALSDSVGRIATRQLADPQEPGFIATRVSPGSRAG